ncbi:YcxB family protein [Lacihabitans soyangensis]|uniref:YcxB family protein n=1 Tax=Lacihabitans soyangensis TaxID=869394 RepID=A0AAE3H1Y9_9BACT|nr:YcxB family protein [Lacihabitans soyangensis]MCP9763564.1 hypothetical protein [Lacihabitans soyangensis]
MNFDLTFVPDRAYYEEAYDEIISTLKRRKYESYLATCMIVFGLFFYFLNIFETLKFFPFILIFFGIYGHFSMYNEKKKWLKDRLDSRVAGQSMQLNFSEEVIKHHGPFSSGEIAWDGIKEILKTTKGILLKPENGISIYLPKTLFKNQKQIDFVLSKKN